MVSLHTSDRGDESSLVRDGFSGPFNLLTADQCALIARHWNHVKDDPPLDYPKAWAAVDRLFFDVATRPRLVALLRPALGEHILLWGASVVSRPVGKVHHWHTDIESSFSDRFVTVWIGLQHTSRESTLKVVTGSHKFGKPIQQVMHERGVKRDMVSDAVVVGWSGDLDPSARLVQPDAADGDALVMDGRLWHASENTRASGTRLALLLQFAAGDERVPMPDFRQGEWPFRVKAEPMPVIAVSGSVDGDRNRLLPAPPAGAHSEEAIGTACRPLVLPLADDAAAGWRSHPLAHGWTPNAPSMGAHVTVLSPGRSPHPPHAHVEEEILIVLAGEADILLGDGPDAARALVQRVPAGAFAYYPAYQYHTIRNASAAPVTYLMFKWSGPPAEIEKQARTGIFRFSDLLTASPARRLQSEKFFEQPTGYLARLHAHVTSLQPGAGYAPHEDGHDVAIVVLSGTVKAAGVMLGPHGLFYFPAGETHGMENVGADPARYLVFEFHSPEPKFDRAIDAGSPHAALSRKSRGRVERLRVFAGKVRYKVSEERRFRSNPVSLAGAILYAGSRFLAGRLGRYLSGPSRRA